MSEASTGALNLGGDRRRVAIRYSWMPLVALGATVAVEVGERQSLSQAVHGIQHQFGVSDFQVSLLPAAMTVVGVAGAFPIGVLADRVRRTWLMAGAMAVWTACMGLNGLVGSYILLFVFRMGVGAVEANGPAAVSLLSDYYPAKDRARVMGLYQSGALVGAVVGLGLGGVAVAAGGWRWAFFMWVPFGAAVAWLVARQPEPRRGDQDADFAADLSLTDGSALGAAEVAATMGGLLPEPIRVGTLDYASAGPREVMAELLRIPSMWYGVLALTISQLLLNGLQFWGVEYFKRVHHLGAAAAGGVAGLLGLGSIGGIVGGGFLADRLLRRGMVNSRVYVVAFGSIAATPLLMPAFASTSLAITAPLLLLGGAALTLPVAPAEALVSDVVVAELRGRAATVRSVVRALSAAGPLLIGLLSSQAGLGLRVALVAVSPIYAAGGLVMLGAARHYPADVAFVVAESQRLRASTGEQA